MTLATVLSLCFVCVAVFAAEGGPPLACNLKAISAAERPRYGELMKRLRIAVQDGTELSDSYAYKVDTTKITLAEVAEWIAMERLCCPFLSFQLNVSVNGDSQLTLRGPDKVKAILREEFPPTSK